MESRRLVLVNPPKGRSQADDYAEKCMNCAHNKMKNTFSDIEKKKNISVTKLIKEQQSIALELRKMRKTTGSLARSKATKEFGSSFLESEKTRIRQSMDSSCRRDGYRSDGASSEESWDDRSEKSSDDDSVDFFVGDDGDKKSHRKSSRRGSKATYEERSREERLDNLQRRFSAQVNLDVKRSSRFPKL